MKQKILIIALLLLSVMFFACSKETPNFIGYWQGDDSFITSAGYESGMYEDYSCFIYLQCHIGTNNYGYKYDYFIPE